MRTTTVRSTWTSYNAVEIPDEVADGDVSAAIGRFDEWVAEQVDASVAELTDWEQAGAIHVER